MSFNFTHILLHNRQECRRYAHCLPLSGLVTCLSAHGENKENWVLFSVLLMTVDLMATAWGSLWASVPASVKWGQHSWRTSFTGLPRGLNSVSKSPKDISKMEKSHHVSFLYFAFPHQFPSSGDSLLSAETHVGLPALSISPPPLCQYLPPNRWLFEQGPGS